MPDAIRVFVSYSHQDAEYANRFVDRLRSSGLDVWYDRQGLLGGQEWAVTIEQELESRPVFIVLLSQAALASEWVRREIYFAVSQNVRGSSRIILPVLISHDVAQMPMVLVEYQYIAGESPDEAAQAVLRALGRIVLPGEPDVEAMVAQGATLRAAGDLAGALNILATAVDRDPLSVSAWVGYGQALAEAQRYDEAIRGFEQALELEPGNELALVSKADTLFAQGHLSAAVEAYGQALRHNARYATAWYNRGTAMLALGLNQEAAENYKTLQSLDPGNSDAYMFEGEALWRLGRRQEAVISFERAIDLKPDCLKDLTRPIRTLIRRYR